MAGFNLPQFSEKGLNNPPLSGAVLAEQGLDYFEDDVLESQSLKDRALSAKELHQAQIWGLTEDEEKRYLALMENKSGLYYEGLHLTPVDILGLNARTVAERAHFAELSAHFEAQKVAQNLAYNSAFHKAYNEIFKNTPVVGRNFDPSPYSPLAHKPVALRARDELYLFVKQTDPVKSIITSLSEAIGQTVDTRLHLMITDASNEDIQLFAHRMGLPHELVLSGRISLNSGRMQYEGLSIENKKTPLLLLARNRASQIVDLGKI